jgi:outer membrane lipopolysaccharide assembly protein LptE/RlpB
MRIADCGVRNFLKMGVYIDGFGLKFRNPNSAIRNFIRALLILCATLFVGCGYQMVGKETHVPPGLSSVAIPTFLNKTLEPGIEVPFTQGFLREFINDRRVNVVDRQKADSVLEGVIKSLRTHSVSYDKSGIVLEYQTTVVIDLKLKKATGEVLWQQENLSETQWYRTSPGTLTSSSILASEANRAAAIQQIGGFMAGRVRNRFFYDF